MPLAAGMVVTTEEQRAFEANKNALGQREAEQNFMSEKETTSQKMLHCWRYVDAIGSIQGNEILLPSLGILEIRREHSTQGGTHVDLSQRDRRSHKDITGPKSEDLKTRLNFR